MSSIVYRGRVFSVEVERVALANGREIELETVRHAPSVVLIPVRPDGRIVMIRQHRHPLGRDIWELPAGSLNPGESAAAAAARECAEEIGEAPGCVERLGSFYPTPGYCDEEMIFFRVSELHPPASDSPHKPDDDEEISARAMTAAEAREMLARGEIVDLKTAYALTLV
jgi:ADP-ribose pyrophosphatase